MASMPHVGTISVYGSVVHWTIHNFSNLPQSEDMMMWSRKFRLRDKYWQLYLVPSGWTEHFSEGWFGMGLFDQSGKSDKSLRVRLGVNGQDTEEIVTGTAEWDGDRTFEALRLIRRLEFDSKSQQILSVRGSLQVFCEIRNLVDSSAAEVSVRAEELDAKDMTERDHNALVEASTETKPEVVKHVQFRLKGAKRKEDSAKSVAEGSSASNSSLKKYLQFLKPKMRNRKSAPTASTHE